MPSCVMYLLSLQRAKISFLFNLRCTVLEIWLWHCLWDFLTFDPAVQTCYGTDHLKCMGKRYSVVLISHCFS